VCRALILSKKISPRAFKEVVKKGTEAGEVGIEGTTIQQPDPVPLTFHASMPLSNTKRDQSSLRWKAPAV
jgi:hypothetical protein